VAGDEDDLRTVGSVGEHNAGVSSGGYGGGDAGYDFKVDAGVGEDL
jgi:hypothetical protein